MNEIKEKCEYVGCDRVSTRTVYRCGRGLPYCYKHASLRRLSSRFPSLLQSEEDKRRQELNRAEDSNQ